MTNEIIKLITLYASIAGVDPVLAISVARVESSLNPIAVGAQGEIGLFQVMPQYTPYTPEELKDVRVNIQTGIYKLKEAKEKCHHRYDYTWLTCYNAGIAGAKKIKRPHSFDYVVKVKKKMADTRSKKWPIRAYANAKR